MTFISCSPPSVGMARRHTGLAAVLLLITLTAALAVARGTVVAAQQSATTTTSLVLDGVTVVDVEHGKLLPTQRVVIAGNRIQTVGDVGAVAVPRGAQVVEARGKYLMPGLWDMHVHALHYTHLVYPLAVAYGITGIRDAGSDVPLDTLMQWRREIVAGTRVGPPRQILSGITNEVPCLPLEGSSAAIPCVPEGDSATARRLVDSLKAAGADMIKMFYLSREMYFVIAAETRRLGIPSGGHISPRIDPAAMLSGEPVDVPLATAMQASDSGVGIIDHPKNSGGLDRLCLTSEERSMAGCQAVAKQFQHNNTWLVPTLTRENGGGSASQPIFDRLHEFSVEFWKADTVLHGGRRPDRERSPADSLGYLYVAHRAGLPILAGTDVWGAPPRLWELLPGFALHAELECYVAEGLTPLEALQTATLNPAKFMHATDSLGTVAAGKLADLLLLDADPLVDITNTMTIRAVVANGRYFDRAALDQLLREVRAKAKEVP